MAQLPQVLATAFNAIIPQASEREWVQAFYQTHIKMPVQEAIERAYSASDHQRRNPHEYSEDISQCLFIKRYFEPAYAQDKAYLPIQSLFDKIYLLEKSLSDKVFQAIVHRDPGLPWDFRLPDYTAQALKEILNTEILITLDHKIKQLSEFSKPNDKRALDKMSYWVRREMESIGPVRPKIKVEIERFKKRVDPNTQTFQIGNAVNSLWYFMNGVDRMPLFIQFELMTLRRIFLSYLSWIKDLSTRQTKIKRNTFIHLPLASLRFLVDVVYLMFIPYRFLRTIVNELVSIFQRAFLSALSHVLQKDSTSWQGMQTLSLLFQWSFYIGLLTLFGLPILPNPIAWMPSLLPAFLVLTPSLYVMGVLLGALGFAVLRQDRADQIEESARTFEKTVEVGLGKVEQLHDKVLGVKPDPFLPHWIKTQKESASDVDKENSIQMSALKPS